MFQLMLYFGSLFRPNPILYCITLCIIGPRNVIYGIYQLYVVGVRYVSVIFSYNNPNKVDQSSVWTPTLLGEGRPASECHPFQLLFCRLLTRQQWWNGLPSLYWYPVCIGTLSVLFCIGPVFSVYCSVSLPSLYPADRQRNNGAYR